MSKSDIKNNINELLIKKFNQIKVESPIHNLSDASFRSFTYKKKTTDLYNKLPSLKKKLNQSMKISTSTIQDISKGENTHLLNLKQKYQSKNYIKNGILWYNNNKIKIPRLIIPEIKTNSVNNLSAERNKYLSQVKNGMRINKNKLYSTKRMEELFIHQEDKKKINEVLRLKKDASHEQKKEDHIFELLLKSLGINKNTEDKIIKKISVGFLNRKNNIKKNKKKSIEIRKIKNNLFNYKNNSMKYIEKDFNKNDFFNNMNQSSSLILKKNNDFKKENKNRNKDELIKHFKKVHFININNNIKKINGQFKYIDIKLNEYLLKAKDNFDIDIKKEFPQYD